MGHNITRFSPTHTHRIPAMSRFNLVKVAKGGLTTRFDPPPNGLRELKLHRSSANGCTKRKIFLKIFFDIRFRS